MSTVRQLYVKLVCICSSDHMTDSDCNNVTRSMSGLDVRKDMIGRMLNEHVYIQVHVYRFSEMIIRQNIII